MLILPALMASASIFHGTPVTTEQAPWLVSLTTRAPICGGALIAPDRVLTAAHCVQGADPGRVSVRLGGVRHAWRGAYFPTTYRDISSPVDPDNPNSSGTIDDLAVIVLKDPITDVTPLPIAQTAPIAGEASLTIGHGATGEPDVPARPRSAAQVVSDACPSAYGARLFHPEKHLCTLDPTPNASQACAGDSGSPVMVQRDGVWAVAGVVTWGGETEGRGCGEGLPDVSERIDAHTALLTATGTFAPYAARRVRVRRTGTTRRCVIGTWKPSAATFKVHWWREGKLRFKDGLGHVTRTQLKETGKTLKVTHGKVGCSVTATTAGGWGTESSYNQL